MILILILIIILIYCNKKKYDFFINDYYEELVYQYSNDYKLLKYYKLPLSRSKFLYNYLFNFTKGSFILKNKLINLDIYLNNIEFVQDNNLVIPIIKKTNLILKDYFDLNIILDETTEIGKFIYIFKKNIKNKMLNCIINSINIKNSYIILSNMINLIIDNEDGLFYDLNLKNALIKYIDLKNIINQWTNKLYDKFENIFLKLDNYMVKLINNKFNSNITTILNLTLEETTNLYYTGESKTYIFNTKLIK